MVRLLSKYQLGGPVKILERGKNGRIYIVRASSLAAPIEIFFKWEQTLFEKIDNRYSCTQSESSCKKQQ